MCHAGLVDAEFLTEQGDLLMGSVKIGFQADSGVGANAYRYSAEVGACNLRA